MSTLLKIFFGFCGICFSFRFVLSKADLHVKFLKYSGALLKEDKHQLVLKNQDVNLKVDCIANQPVEWIFNVPFKFGEDDNPAIYGAWTYRDYDTQNTTQPEFTYTARIEIKYSAALKFEEILRCKLVLNATGADTDYALQLFIQPDNAQINITTSKILPEEMKPNYSLGKPESPHIISYAVLENGYHWKCRTKEGMPQNISIVRCTSPMLCANLHKEIRNGPILEIVKNKTSLQLLAEGDWYRENRQDVLSAGIIICEGDLFEGVSGFEFFFGGMKSGINNYFQRHDLYLNYNEIDRSKLIRFKPLPRKIYYSKQELELATIVSLNGFSYAPQVEVIRNGIVIQQAKDFKKQEDEVDDVNLSTSWKKELTLDFKNLGPGNYTINCIAPIWNSTGWANKTVSFQVKDAIRPKFSKEFDILLIDPDIKNFEINCNVEGDPMPDEFSWSPLPIPASSFKNRDAILVLGKTVGSYADENYTCTATNKFGQEAKKTFQIKVHKSKSDGGDNSTIIIAVCSLAACLLVAVGIIFFYFRFKFHDLHSKITTHLTKEEVDEFLQGKPNPGADNLGNTEVRKSDNQRQSRQEDDESLAVDCLPYNAKYEVPNELIIVDWNCILGSGEYGIVYKGSVANKYPNEPPIPVAIKTVRKNVHINYFKALMSELKILAYIGHHENVACLIGAWTENIQNREMLVCVERCENSLLKFLQGNRRNFKNLVQKDGKLPKETALTMPATTDEYGNAEVINYISARNDSLDNYQLITWSYQIACGMEFLTSKKVVHADLATRNVLLSTELQAKICDFGLARQLIDYDYVKSENCPLPWKWMAIESLSQRTFNSKTDVWAYGITLWEIFSLGNVPYPGLGWTVNFVEELVRGLRMAKPEFADDTIYNVMLECWRDEPKGRPNFTKLKDILKSIQLEHSENATISIV